MLRRMIQSISGKSTEGDRDSCGHDHSSRNSRGGDADQVARHGSQSQIERIEYTSYAKRDSQGNEVYCAECRIYYSVFRRHICNDC